MRKLVAGNWKMNGKRADLDQVAQLGSRGVEVLICPPFTLIEPLAQRDFARVFTGAQNCDSRSEGAHTGDVSASQVVDAGGTHVILGHSERRSYHHETDHDIVLKAASAHEAGLVTLICVGETRAQREGGQALEVISTQLAGSVPIGANAHNTVIAYEPVWAIGTGLTPTIDQIAEVHALIRDRLAARFEDGAAMRLLYGGSVKGSNAAEIFAIPNVEGALVGGASLKAADFQPIIDALDAS